MKTVLSTLLMLCIGLVLHAQTEEIDPKPDEQIIVNKEYDEEGNLIGYDSTYIHQWSSDSTFQFDFGHAPFFGNGLEDLNGFMEEFFNDSNRFSFHFPDNFDAPMEHDDFFRQFEQMGPDSLLMDRFFLHRDSLFHQFPIDSLNNLPHHFAMPDMKDFQKRLQEQIGNFQFPEHGFMQDLDDEQMKELQELQEKHRKELDELKQKWEEKK